MGAADISIYDKVKKVDSNEVIALDLFLEGIRIGKWEDIVLPIRAINDKKERNEAKTKKAPVVTLSGQFSKRKDECIIKHSGYIGIDIDQIEDPEQIKNILKKDRYIVAAFTSISGRGVCVIFHINPSKHQEAFRGACQYLYEVYDMVCDPTSVNVSRARFVSFDPYIYIASNYDKFTLYPKKVVQKKVPQVVFVQEDFDDIIKEITTRRINLCESYDEWLRVGFALATEFGEVGRNYFHLVSQFSAKYNSKSADKQFDACLRAKGSQQATISTFYYYCKNAGIPLYSTRTKLIAYSAAQSKKAGLNKKQIADNLKKFEGIEDAENVIKQVFDKNIEIEGDGIIDELEIWLRQNYDLKRNEITRYIENCGRNLENKDFNSIFISAKKIFPEVSYELLDRLINSDFVKSYNPFIEFIEQHKHNNSKGNIEKLFSSINTNDDKYLLFFGRKWLVSIISSIFGTHSPLMLVLTGELQNTGKTEFFRRLLPEPLKKYYAESKLDAGKDDEILMTQKLIIMDDEMGGKSKRENKRLKELTSKQTFSLREPYGRNNVDLVRLAVLCGTSNDNELLNDPTGNRRIIPVQVFGIDHEIYNNVDKTKLFIEVYNLYKEGFAWQLNKEDIEYLGQDKITFEVTNLEKELIQKYFEEGSTEMTASEIKIHIEDKSRQKLYLNKIGHELKALGFKQKKVDGGSRRVYLVKERLPYEYNKLEKPPF